MEDIIVKHLYDPHMFNYMWESCIPPDDYIVGTYYIEDMVEDQDFIDHLGQVERLAAEGSTSSWMDVKELTDEVRERLMSKVLGYYEIPAPKGTKKAIIQLGFPTAAWDVNVNVPMLLLSIAGNCFAFPTKMRLLDIYIPEKLAQKFKGPKFGVPGVREILGVYDRPLTLQIIKPKMGMTPEETANQVYQSALGGVDLCKDDEMCTELENCSFDARLEAVLKALEKAEARDRPQDALHGQHHRRGRTASRRRRGKACAMGATGLLLAYSAGPSVLRVLAEDPKITAPILLHVSHLLALLPTMNFPCPGQDLPAVRRGHDAHAVASGRASRWRRSRSACASRRRCTRRSTTSSRSSRCPARAIYPGAVRADAGGERPGHDLHGRRRHAGPPDGLHRRRQGVPPGDRRGHGRHPARRRRAGQARAAGRARRPGAYASARRHAGASPASSSIRSSRRRTSEGLRIRRPGTALRG